MDTVVQENIFNKRKKEKMSTKKIGKWYMCNTCDYRTIYTRSLKMHVINKHTPVEGVDWQQCDKCWRKFKTLNNLKQHLRQVHVSAVDHLHCPECDYSSPSRWNLKQHINRKHARLEEIKWVESHDCGAKFKEKENLKVHLMTHSSEEKKCEHCDYSSKYRKELNNHITLKHIIDGEVFKCKECDYNTPSKVYFDKHIRRTHNQSNQSKLACENCSFVTKTKKSLERHVSNRHTVHTEEEKLSCPQCTYFCFRKEYMTKHLKFRHEIGDKIRWYECGKCNYKHQLKRFLDSHMYKMHKIGKLLKCNQCVYKTGSPIAMDSHKRKHKTMDPEDSQ